MKYYEVTIESSNNTLKFITETISDANVIINAVAKKGDSVKIIVVYDDDYDYELVANYKF